MNYNEAVEYLYNRLPVFQNIGARAYKPGLASTREICTHLGNPQKCYKTIHVAGTNGKGSTSHMLAAILQKAGYRTGLYTSPHLKSFRERIRINGEMVSEDFIANFVTTQQPFIESISPSFFEITVGMAFDYFAQEKVDVAVIEVGLGGRVDSTNVIEPELSVITNISFDHVKQLGDTLPKIAFEKAGIIKPHTPVVISEKQGQEVEEVFLAKAQEQEAPLVFASDCWRVNGHRWEEGLLVIDLATHDNSRTTTYRLELAGTYQCKNILGVLSAVDILRAKGWKIAEQALAEALASTRTITGLKGRWQVLNSQPYTVCDTAHNPAGFAGAIGQFMSVPAKRRIFVLGFVGDKDVAAILQTLPSEATYYFCQPSNVRALAAEELAEKAKSIGIVGEVIPDVNEAIRKATEVADDVDAIYVGGSTFVVADIDNL